MSRTSTCLGVGHDDTLRKQYFFWPHNYRSQGHEIENEIVVHYVKHLRLLPDDPTCGEKDDIVTVTGRVSCRFVLGTG